MFDQITGSLKAHASKLVPLVKAHLEKQRVEQERREPDLYRSTRPDREQRLTVMSESRWTVSGCLNQVVHPGLAIRL